jgi:hypothetical protein
VHRIASRSRQRGRRSPRRAGGTTGRSGSTIPLSPHRSLPAWSKPTTRRPSPAVVTPQGGLIPEPNAPRRQRRGAYACPLVPAASRARQSQARGLTADLPNLPPAKVAPRQHRRAAPGAAAVRSARRHRPAWTQGWASRPAQPGTARSQTSDADPSRRPAVPLITSDWLGEQRSTAS